MRKKKSKGRWEGFCGTKKKKNVCEKNKKEMEKIKEEEGRKELESFGNE